MSADGSDSRPALAEALAQRLAARFAALAPDKRVLFLDKLRQEKLDFAALPIPRIEDASRFRASYAQSRLWLLHRLDPRSAAYNIPALLKLDGALDVDALRAALAALAQRHEQLRARFEERDGEVYCLIDEQTALPLQITDLRSAAAALAEHRASADADAAAPFDLQRGPVWRAQLLQLSGREHRLQLVLHHIVSDGWSMNLLMDEFCELYAAQIERRAATLIELPLRYADYALWQRRWLESGELQRQLGYWTQQLGANHEPLALPTDRPRPAVAGSEAGSIRFDVEAPLSRALSALARRENTTEFVVLLAAFQLLLARLSGHSEVRVGVPIANRNRYDTENLVGFFANTLVLCAHIDGTGNFRDLLAAVRESVLAAQAHQELPFEQLVEALNPRRSLAHSPLFQVLFNHRSAAGGDRRQLGALSVEVQPQPVRATQFDLALYTEQRGDGIQAGLAYRSELFDRVSVERIAAQWQCLLQAIVDAPATPLSRLPLIGEAERRALLSAHRDAGLEFDPQLCLPQRIEAQAAVRPEAIALVYGAASLSYAELDARSNRLARELRARGVGPEVRVGVMLERGPGLIVALLAVLKAGGAYVPLDPAYPAQRLALMLEDAQPRVLITDRGAALAGDIDSLDPADPALARHHAGALPPLARGANLAYCIYTSGSTGRPKGVAVTHAALMNFLLGIDAQLRLVPDDRVLGLTSLSFDIAVLELWLPLLRGARIALVGRDEATDAALLLRRVREVGASVVQATPTHWRALAAQPEFGALASAKLLCGGEALDAALAQRLAQTGREAWNLYGPTETTVWSAMQRLRADSAQVTLGGPIANTALFVLDEELEPVPPNVIGELYIGGLGLARGYLHRAALTAERFVPDPFSADGGRLYRSGDRVRLRVDGQGGYPIEYLGRIDQQLKIRGHRIEAGEIEARLRELPGVRGAAVGGVGDARGEQQLVAWVVAAPSDNDAARIETWQRALREQLPAFMLPSRFVRVDALPLTPNGKLDRKALPAPDASTLKPAAVAPRDELERAIAAVWSAVLRRERIGVHEDFFEVGGHSLLATQLLSQLRERLGLELTLRELFERNSIAQLADRLRSRAAPVDEPHIDLMKDLLNQLEQD